MEIGGDKLTTIIIVFFGVPERGKCAKIEGDRMVTVKGVFTDGYVNLTEIV